MKSFSGEIPILKVKNQGKSFSGSVPHCEDATFHHVDILDLTGVMEYVPVNYKTTLRVASFRWVESVATTRD